MMFTLVKSSVIDSLADGGHRSKFAPKSSSSSSASRRTQSLFTSGSNCQSLSAQSISALNIRSLLVGSSTSVRQTIKVDSLEDEILSGGQVAAAATAGSDRPSSASSVFDFDKVSERVEMDATADGKIVLTSTARSERVVPIAGADYLFKKKAVVVTKRIQIDMTLTPQRRQLFDMVKKQTTNGGGGHDDDIRRDDDSALDKKAIGELYKKFVALAELDRAIAS